MAEKIPAVYLDFHPMFDVNAETWSLNERRMAGGRRILRELRPFDWETLPGEKIPEEQELSKDDLIPEEYLKALKHGFGSSAWRVKPGDHYRFRQNMATYLNFPDMFAYVMNGHLMKNRPMPGGDLHFGDYLGKVERKRITKDASRAELLYFNADGVGNDGAQWDNYWAGAMRRAMATGHRWIYIDSPKNPPGNRRTLVERNLRPYVTDFSPLAVSNWGYEHGLLMFIVLQIPSRRVRMDGDALVGNEGTTDYLVMTRRGFEGFGDYFERGGWWHIDRDGMVIKKGTWANTDGEIPMFPLYYQRDVPTITWEDKKLDWDHSMSVPAITEIGNAAVAYMNISSAADFDAWDAAASIQFLRGVDEDGWDVAMRLLRSGSRYVALPAVVDSEGRGQVPVVQDGSMGAVVATTFDMALKRKLDEVARLAVTQATESADSSGLSKAAGFGEAKVPRLALIASELEAAQNTALYFIERRWGNRKPEAQVLWTRDFDLVSLTDRIEQHFTLENLAKMHSETVDTRGLVLSARKNGLVTDESDINKIIAEYTKSAALRDMQTALELQKRVTDPAPTGRPSGQGPQDTQEGLEGARPAQRAIIEEGGDTT